MNSNKPSYQRSNPVGWHDDVFAKVIDPETGEIYGGRPWPRKRPCDIAYMLWWQERMQKEAAIAEAVWRPVQRKARKQQREQKRGNRD